MRCYSARVYEGTWNHCAVAIKVFSTAAGIIPNAEVKLPSLLAKIKVDGSAQAIRREVDVSTVHVECNDTKRLQIWLKLRHPHVIRTSQLIVAKSPS